MAAACLSVSVLLAALAVGGVSVSVARHMRIAVTVAVMMAVGVRRAVVRDVIPVSFHAVGSFRFSM